MTIVKFLGNPMEGGDTMQEIPDLITSIEQAAQLKVLNKRYNPIL